jgi:ferredoxin-NADP reductase
MAHVASGHLHGGEVGYLCRPPPMVDTVRAWLGDQSVTRGKFCYEKFSPSGDHFCADAGPANVAGRIAAAAKPRRSPSIYLSSQTSSKREPL